MRKIANFAEQKIALRFWNFLQKVDIQSNLEKEDSKEEWSIWVIDEENIERSIEYYSAFKKDPQDSKYDAPKKETSANKSEDNYPAKKNRFKNYNLSQKWKNQNRGTGPVSLALIIVSVAVFLISAMGKNFDVIKPFLISTQESNFFKDILGGQIWRIITPIFLHFSILHIFFNMYWLYELGGQIEKRKGSKFIATLILIIAAVSNLSELIFGGPIFGGMSGVVYGLFGYVWTKCRFDPGDGLYIHQTTALIMLGWFFLCFANIIPGIANWAHAGGLFTGALWGYISAVRWNRV